MCPQAPGQSRRHKRDADSKRASSRGQPLFDTADQCALPSRSKTTDTSGTPRWRCAGPRPGSDAQTVGLPRSERHGPGAEEQDCQRGRTLKPLAAAEHSFPGSLREGQVHRVESGGAGCDRLKGAAASRGPAGAAGLLEGRSTGKIGRKEEATRRWKPGSACLQAGARNGGGAPGGLPGEEGQDRRPGSAARSAGSPDSRVREEKGALVPIRSKPWHYRRRRTEWKIG